eukprot:scaffold11426_cov78-Cylindrotheca_fusiformis.AAC.1
MFGVPLVEKGSKFSKRRAPPASNGGCGTLVEDKFGQLDVSMIESSSAALEYCPIDDAEDRGRPSEGFEHILVEVQTRDNVANRLLVRSCGCLPVGKVEKASGMVEHGYCWVLQIVGLGSESAS